MIVALQRGLLLLDKPIGFSSNDVLRKVARYYEIRKAGHTGTLDPFASGLLPICLGQATKYSQQFLNADKTYRFTIQFGVSTTTGDIEGEVLKQQKTKLSMVQLTDVLHRLQGELLQTAPRYSALKYQGKPLYYWARKGIEVPRKERHIVIYRLHALSFEAAKQQAYCEVVCSKGTYIRQLAEQIGDLLDVPASLIQLQRTQVGHLSLQSAQPLTELEVCHKSQQRQKLAQFLLPTHHLFPLNFQRVVLHNTDLVRRLMQGKSISLDNIDIAESIMQTPEQSGLSVAFDKCRRFLGVVTWDKTTKALYAKRLMNMNGV